MKFDQHLSAPITSFELFAGLKLWTVLGKCTDPANNTQNTLSIMLELPHDAQTSESDCLNNSIEQSSLNRHDYAAIGDEKRRLAELALLMGHSRSTPGTVCPPSCPSETRDH